MSEAPTADPRACPECGIGFMEFRRCGRLGCPNDYDRFRTELLPLLDRIHRAGRHEGKRPRAKSAPPAAYGALRLLRRQLAAAAAAGDYEEAARLRDAVRAEDGRHGL